MLVGGEVMKQTFRVVIGRIDEVEFLLSANTEDEAKNKAKKLWKECAYGIPLVIDIEEVIE